MYLKNSLYNIFFGFISQIITIGLGIIIPRMFLMNFGSELNGLIASLQQIFTYLTLLEVGVGAASLQALYSPIAKQNYKEINGILSATHKYYKKTGCIYFIAVLSIAIIYPIFTTSEINKIKITVLVLVMGMSGVLSYFFQAKFKLFLQASGKEYITINLVTICNILSSFMKIIMLNFKFDIITIQLIYFLITVVQVIFIQIYIKKNYSWINYNVKPNYDSISQKGSVLVHQISTLIFSNTDVLLLTFFCDLKVVSVYVMYNMLFGMAQTLFSTINGSIVFALGQTYHKDKERFIKIYNIYEVYITTIAFGVYGVAYMFILPFLRLYTSGINDINYIDNILAILFLISNLLSTLRLPSSNVISIAGHFKETKIRSVIESAINLTCSIIFVKIFGIYGVLVGTIVALLYRTNDMIIYCNKKILKRSLKRPYKIIYVNIILLVISITIFQNLNLNLNSYGKIILNASIIGVLIGIIFFIVISLFDIKSFKSCYNYVKSYINNKKIKLEIE